MNLPIFILSSVTAFLVLLAIERFLRWRLSRNFNKVLETTLQQIENGTYEDNAEPSPIQLSWDDSAFTVRNSQTEEETSVPWQNVHRATAFKRDLLTYDEVCVAFDLNGDLAFEINETMNGFTDFMEAAPDHLPGFITFSDWYMDITTPAFETNLTPLFDRQDAEPDRRRTD